MLGVFVLRIIISKLLRARIEANMRFGTCEIIALVAFSLSVCAFDDPISVIGRIRWNYTSYEENLWTRQFQNTTLEQIYRDHNEFIDKINSAYNDSDSFFPVVNTSAVDSIKNRPVIDSYLINPYHVPAIQDVVLSNEQVTEYWAKFANWSSYNTSNMLEVLTDDAIPALQTSIDALWNTTNTDVYFDYLKNVRHNRQQDRRTIKIRLGTKIDMD